MMNDPFADDFLIIWVCDGDEPIFSYVKDEETADHQFDVWVQESRDNGEDNSHIIVFNLSNIRQTGKLAYHRHWESADG